MRLQQSSPRLDVQSCKVPIGRKEMLYIQESEDENRPFGPDTYENLGGIVA